MQEKSTITAWLRQATAQLKNAGVDSARLDAELLLAQTLRKSRTYLHAHLEEEIDPRRLDIAAARLSLRLDRVPLAYILGVKEFYGRQFVVSPDVLIPRPESEAMVSLLLELTAGEIAPRTLIDVGTGSGCLGITIALERPNFRVILSDSSPQALRIAQKNAALLQTSHGEVHLDISFVRQSLLSKQLEPVDYIIANLPYVDRSWTDTSPELRHEPAQALYAEEGGLRLIRQLISQTPRHLAPGGLLLLEADPTQHQAIITEAAAHRLQHITTAHYIIALRLQTACIQTA